MHLFFAGQHSQSVIVKAVRSHQPNGAESASKDSFFDPAGASVMSSVPSLKRVSMQKDALFESPSTVLDRNLTLGLVNQKRSQTVMVS